MLQITNTVIFSPPMHTIMLGGDFLQIIQNINFKKLFISCGISLGVGALSSIVSMKGFMKYHTINQPPLSPPGVVFPIVWTILFILMGISAYLIYVESESETSKKAALKIYAIQLVVNFFWPIIFFNFSLYLFAFVWLLLLVLLVIIMIYVFWGINKTAAILNIPYLLWLLFAAYLNFGVYLLN